MDLLKCNGLLATGNILILWSLWCVPLLRNCCSDGGPGGEGRAEGKGCLCTQRAQTEPWELLIPDPDHLLLPKLPCPWWKAALYSSGKTETNSPVCSDCQDFVRAPSWGKGSALQLCCGICCSLRLPALLHIPSGHWEFLYPSLLLSLRSSWPSWCRGCCASSLRWRTCSPRTAPSTASTRARTRAGACCWWPPGSRCPTPVSVPAPQEPSTGSPHVLEALLALSHWGLVQPGAVQGVPAHGRGGAVPVQTIARF